MSPTKTSLGLLFVDKKTVFIGILVLAAAFAIGVLIGYYGKGDENPVLITDNKIIHDYVTDQFKENDIFDFFLRNTRSYLEISNLP